MKTDINKILTYVIIGLAAVILLGTLTAFMAGKARIGNVYRHGDPSGVAQIKGSENLAEYKEIGTIRALTKPESEEVAGGVNIVVTPWFAYEKSDSAFTEELAQKKQAYKTIFLNYFASHTQKQLFSLGEKQVKDELLELINQNLVMGKIQAIYFDDYIFLD